VSEDQEARIKELEQELKIKELEQKLDDKKDKPIDVNVIDETPEWGWYLVAFMLIILYLIRTGRIF